MDRVLVKLYVPVLEKTYDVWLPTYKKIYNIIPMLVKAINELNGNCYRQTRMPLLYDRITAEEYDINLSVKESSIRSGTEIILI